MGELLGGALGAWVWVSLVAWFARVTIRAQRRSAVTFGLLTAPTFALVMRRLVMDSVPDTGRSGTPVQFAIVWGLGALLIAWPVLARAKRLDAAEAESSG